MRTMWPLFDRRIHRRRGVVERCFGQWHGAATRATAGPQSPSKSLLRRPPCWCGHDDTP